MGAAAYRQSHGNAGGDSPERLDVAARRASGDRRRLSRLDPGRLNEPPSFRPAFPSPGGPSNGAKRTLHAASPNQAMKHRIWAMAAAIAGMASLSAAGP